MPAAPLLYPDVPTLCFVDPQRSQHIPHRATQGSNGWDLHACLPQPIALPRNRIAKIPTNLRIALPLGRAGLVLSRSGLTLDRRLVVANAPGLIDTDYRGEIFVLLQNQHPFDEQIIEDGLRIAQLLFVHTETYSIEMKTPLGFERYMNTDRGEQGFGSSGD